MHANSENFVAMPKKVTTLLVDVFITNSFVCQFRKRVQDSFFFLLRRSK